MDNRTALQYFFDEKDIDVQSFTIIHNNITHIVDMDFLINIILNVASAAEQEKIRTIIALIDFKNGDVTDFLKHLAQAYIQIHY